MSTFKNTVNAGVGTTPVSVYTASGNAVIIGLDLANTNSVGSSITVNVTITKGATTIYYVKNAPLPPGSTLQVIAGQKIILTNGDILKISASVDTSVDVLVSILEGV